MMKTAKKLTDSIACAAFDVGKRVGGIRRRPAGSAATGFRVDSNGARLRAAHGSQWVGSRRFSNADKDEDRTRGGWFSAHRRGRPRDGARSRPRRQDRRRGAAEV